MNELDILMNIVKRRRSTRSFKPDSIPDEAVEKILDAAHWAMSAANGQPWEFIVIKDQDMRQKIAMLRPQVRKWTTGLEESRVPSSRHPSGMAGGEGAAPFGVAPVLIAILGDPRTLVSSTVWASLVVGEREFFHQSMANTASVIQLAATAANLNSEWISVTADWEASLKNLLGVPELYRLPLMAALGYAAKDPRPGFRRNLQELVHNERYDMSKFRSTRAVLDYVPELHKRRTG